MMNNGIMFGTGGPMMTGTWYNPSTGDSFTVRDCFFENNQYVISTTDGRMLGYDVIQNYVQSDKPIEMPKKTQEPSLPNEVMDILDDRSDDDIFVDTDIYGTPTPVSLGNLNTSNSRTVDVASNVGIIKKALDKASKPEVVANIVWSDFPKKQIEMLAEIMEIDTKEIVEWYASQLDTTRIAIAIHNSLVSYINEQLYGHKQIIEDTDLTLETEMYTEYEHEPINSVAKESRMFVDETPVKKTPKKAPVKKSTKKTTKK